MAVLNATKSKKCLLSAIVLVCMSVLVACTIQLRRLKQNDTIAPTIVVNSPLDLSVFGDDVVVEGTITDLANADGEVGELNSTTFLVLGTLRGEDIVVDEAGSFSFSFSTVGLAWDITVEIYALDWNDNQSTAALTLLSP